MEDPEKILALDVTRDGSLDGLRRGGRLYVRVDQRWVWLDLDSSVYRQFFQRLTLAGELSLLQAQYVVDPIESLRSAAASSEDWSVDGAAGREVFSARTSRVDRAGAVHEPAFSADLEFRVRIDLDSPAVPDVDDSATWFGDEPAYQFVERLTEYDAACTGSSSSARGECLAEIARTSRSTVAEFSAVEASAVCPLN